MGVALVNNCVVMPHLPDWGQRVNCGRKWATATVEGLSFTQDRQANRKIPLRSLSFVLRPYHIQERARIVERVAAALQSGAAMVPFWGRGVQLTASASGTTATVDSSWPWAVGDWVFFADPAAYGAERWDVRQITGIAGSVLTFGSALSRTYAAGTQCWPVLMGTLASESWQCLTNHDADIGITITEPLGTRLARASCSAVMEPTPRPNTEELVSPGAGCEQFASDYNWFLLAGQDPSALLSPTDMLGSIVIARGEMADFIASYMPGGYEVKLITPFFWAYRSSDHLVARKGASAKVNSGVWDHQSSTGDVLVYADQWFQLSAWVCWGPI